MYEYITKIEGILQTHSGHSLPSLGEHAEGEI